jgi:histidinol-phosphate aminotransferase
VSPVTAAMAVDRCDMLALAAAGVRGLEPYQPGKPIEELEREYGVKNAIKLASNENPLGASPQAIAAARAALGEIARYPDGNGFILKRALARRYGLAVEQIVLGNGSNDILELVARAFVTPQNEVVFSQHAFAVYPIVTQAVGARAVVTPAKSWGHDLEAMRAAVNDRTRVVFVANPNNPTGTWLGRAELEGFLAGLPGHVIAVLDEAYFEYVQEGDYPDGSQWLGRFPNLIVARTFSKVYGLAGLRVGYGLMGAEIAGILNRVRQPFNVNSVAMAAAAAALDDRGHVARSVKLNTEGMAQLVAGFRVLGLEHIPSVGNFVCVDLKIPARPHYEALLREGVIVRPVGNYGMPNHLRVTVGLPEENGRFLKALETVLRARD